MPGPLAPLRAPARGQRNRLARQEMELRSLYDAIDTSTASSRSMASTQSVFGCRWLLVLGAVASGRRIST